MSADKATTQVEKWTLAPEISLPKKEDLFEMDDDTRAFDGECRTIVSEARADPTERTVQVALLKLQNEFWWRYEAASPGQKRVSGSRNRLCVTFFDLYRKYFLELRTLRRKVTPLLRESTLQYESAPPPEPEAQFQGIHLGKDLGSAFE